MDWNAQTFFDDEECGAEFDEFRGTRTEWDTERYERRLDRLAEVILRAGSAAGMGPERGPDIVALQEVENAKVLRDLCARLPATASYEAAVFVPQPPGGSFGCAVLSRYPVVSVRAHTPHSPDTPLRPMIEARLETPGGPFVVFSVHWKSKVGSGGDTELRAAQERVLAHRIAALRSESPGIPFAACGDFNCGAEESALLSRYSGFWPSLDASPDTNEGLRGSYWYDGSWECIDHVIWPDSAPYAVTRVLLLDEPPLVDSTGHPARYALYSGNGYSDHLPLIVEFSRDN